MVVGRRLILILIVFSTLFIGCFGVLPAWEGPVYSEIGRLRLLETLGERGLPEIHRVLSSTHSILVKNFAAGAIERLLKDESIKPLIKELGYEGRWWVAWWDYEERDKADGYRSTVAPILVKYGPRAVPQLLETLRTGSIPQRYWAVWILGKIASPESIEGLKGPARGDSNEKVKAKAQEMLRELGVGIMDPGIQTGKTR